MLTITFTQEELNTIVKAIDVAIKATGIEGAKALLPMIEKFEHAVQESNKLQENQNG